MNRRRFVLASLATLAVPQVARAQTTASGCTVGFVNGILQFDPNCSTLTIPGLPFTVAPPSNLVPAASSTSTTGTTNVVQEQRVAQLQRKRDHKRSRQNRQAKKHDHRHTQRARKRDNRHNQRVAQRAPTSATVSGNQAQLSSSFELASGLYFATATIVADSTPGDFVATLMGPSGFNNQVFSLKPSSDGTNTYQAEVTLNEDGDYLWNVSSADGKWALDLSLA
jgi:hypothetical protein